MEQPDTQPEPAELPGTEEHTDLRGITELMFEDLDADRPGQSMDPLLRAMLAFC